MNSKVVAGGVCHKCRRQYLKKKVKSSKKYHHWQFMTHHIHQMHMEGGSCNGTNLDKQETPCGYCVAAFAAKYHLNNPLGGGKFNGQTDLI